MCKGIKDLFLVIYRNLIHHLHHFCDDSFLFSRKVLKYLEYSKRCPIFAARTSVTFDSEKLCVS